MGDDLDFRLVPVTEKYLMEEMHEVWDKRYIRLSNYMRLYKWWMKYFG